VSLRVQRHCVEPTPSFPSSISRLSSLECAVPQYAPITPLEYAVPKTKDFKSSGICRYTKNRGDGGKMLTSHPSSFWNPFPGVHCPELMASFASLAVSFFPRLGSRRLLALGGIGLILVGMLFGDIFAVFILHQNASHVGASLSAAAHAALAGDSPAVLRDFQNVGSFLENRGTKVDTHVHMIDFGYLALLLAILQPWVAFSEAAKKRFAWIF